MGRLQKTIGLVECFSLKYLTILANISILLFHANVEIAERFLLSWQHSVSVGLVTFPVLWIDHNHLAGNQARYLTSLKTDSNSRWEQEHDLETYSNVATTANSRYLTFINRCINSCFHLSPRYIMADCDRNKNTCISRQSGVQRCIFQINIPTTV